MLFTGFDLGQAADFTALATAEQSPAVEPTPRRRFQYAVRFLKRWELGTSYVQMAKDAAALFGRAPLTWSWLAADYTGVGRAVVDQLRAEKVPAHLRPVLITAGDKVTEDEWGAVHVPKRELVATTVALFQSGLVKIAPGIPEADRLRKELALFTAKVSRRSANEQFGTWADGQHDDLVLALMLALWLGERYGGGNVKDIRVQPAAQSAVHQAPTGVFAEGGEL